MFVLEKRSFYFAVEPCLWEIVRSRDAQCNTEACACPVGDHEFCHNIYVVIHPSACSKAYIIILIS